MAAPSVFISSTSKDLEEHREAAKNAAIKAKFLPVMSEHFPASGEPAVDECLAKVDECDVAIVLVAHRYGWVPKRHRGKSITWLECERAIAGGKKLITLVVSDKAKWPREHYEEHRLTENLASATATLFKEVQGNVKKLAKFRQWLTTDRLANFFVDEKDVGEQVFRALKDWKPATKAAKPAGRKATRKKPASKPKPSPQKYLEYLCEAHSHIDIRGLVIGAGRAHRFPLEDLFIPLQTNFTPRSEEGSDDVPMERTVQGRELHEALAARRLVIVGDPGAGKSTFLKRIAYNLALAGLGRDPGAAADRLGITEKVLPVLIRVGELDAHLQASRKSHVGPKLGDDPQWLVHYLAAHCRSYKCELTGTFWQDELDAGRVIVMLDGLDEAPNRDRREETARFFENVVKAYGKCRFVVTTRPRAYTGAAVLGGFEEATIEPIERESIETFLTHWCKALFPKAPRRREKHHKGLSEALQARAEIRRMARNPVMITALAVVHWNQKRIPEQRADLYESIIHWLLESRKKRKGRASVEICRERLRALALAMQCGPEGRIVQISKREAAEAIEHLFPQKTKPARIRAGEAFLTEEEVDSGVVSSIGHDLRFWHLTFQEYLAARALGELADPAEQMEVLQKRDRLFHSEWRETVLLFGGVLRTQGKPKIDRFVSAVLDGLGDEPDLAAKARVAGVLGGVVRDLEARDYTPKDKRYAATIQEVYGIFEPETAYEVPLETRVEAADALALVGDRRFADAEKNWVRIDGGTFWMGAQSKKPKGRNYDPEAEDRESPVHRVTLSPFEIGRFPVTVAEYAEFVEEAGYEAPRGWDAQIEHRSRPVVDVRWHDAAAYCQWLSGEMGRIVRLPSEAEWEFAARGVDGRRFPWGREEPDERRANFGNQMRHASPVGLYPAGTTPHSGLVDMAGNVVEWTGDWFGEYRRDPVTDPRGPVEGNERVLRGGSWNFYPRSLRVSFRVRFPPDVRYSYIGFRCVREVPLDS